MNKIVNGVEVPLSDTDVAQREADEAAWAAGANAREVARIERSSGMCRRDRDIAIASLPVEHFWRVKAEATEKAIAALGVRRA